MDIKPIETEYKGFLFRSRLEARYAVFFDTLGVKWEYETEGYEIDGIRYLPDFWLPMVTCRNDEVSGVFVEVKPAIRLTPVEENKITALGYFKPTFCFHGLPGQHHEMFQDSAYEYNGDGWDNCMAFVHCPNCNHVKVEFAEGNYMFCPKCSCHADSETERLVNAYKSAKQARFEHGWSGVL